MDHAAPPGAPCWVELFTPDTDAAAAFYGGLFGWTAGEPSEEHGGYRMFFRGDQPVAGCMVNQPSSGSPSVWTVYLATDDARALTDRVRAAGGQVVVEPMPVDDLGTMAVYSDPAGAAVAAWQPDTFPGFLTREGVGAPAWFETLTQDYDATVAFYRDVFGWETAVLSDTDDFRYTTLGEGDEALAGIHDAATLLGPQPSRWDFYVWVDDTDAAVARAQELGGALLEPVEDSPYGRNAALTDPAGVPFFAMGPNLQA